jgi:hypothetical protein
VQDVRDARQVKRDVAHEAVRAAVVLLQRRDAAVEVVDPAEEPEVTVDEFAASTLNADFADGVGVDLLPGFGRAEHGDLKLEVLVDGQIDVDGRRVHRIARVK